MGRPVGTKRVRVEMTFKSTGEKVVFEDYDKAGARIGVSGETLRVYLAHGRGKITREVWSDKLGANDSVHIRRIGVDPLTIKRPVMA